MGGTSSVTTPCRILDSSDVSDGHAASIFRVNELVQVIGRITYEGTQILANHSHGKGRGDKCLIKGKWELRVRQSE